MKGHCRSCGAPVRWVRTVNGKTMPLDPDPTPDGNIIAVVEPGGGRVAQVIGKDDLIDESVPRYKSHFATCPNADQHRKRGTQ
jgi:hypothetical protein